MDFSDKSFCRHDFASLHTATIKFLCFLFIHAVRKKSGGYAYQVRLRDGSAGAACSYFGCGMRDAVLTPNVVYTANPRITCVIGLNSHPNSCQDLFKIETKTATTTQEQVFCS
jgi:hypothetical protein